MTAKKVLRVVTSFVGVDLGQWEPNPTGTRVRNSFPCAVEGHNVKKLGSAAFVGNELSDS